MAEQRVIVVGVDLEEDGDDAIRAALTRRAEVPALRLHFVFAADASNLPDEFGDAEFDNDEEVIEFAQGLVRRRVEHVAKALGHATDSALGTAHAVLGRPVPALLKVCAKYDAELLIVGTHARRGFDRLVLGSVAEELLRQAPCDVLIARSGMLAASKVAGPLEADEVREH